MISFRTLSALALSTLVNFALITNPVQAEPKVEVIKRADVEFIPLNPARGDASPQAGVLWGDIRKDVGSGALITFAPGFASPPHIHNITYRAVVIEGAVHNDDPGAGNMWMPPGSFWTQPAGEVHITSVGPEGGTAFLEIQSGPYLVQPSARFFDNGERPVNLDARNIIWLTADDLTWIDAGAGDDGPEMAFLWGKPERGRTHGSFVKLPADHSATLNSGGAALKIVLIAGQLDHAAGDLVPASMLEAGSYVGSEGSVAHDLSCAPGAECILYVRATGKYRVTSAE